VIEIGPNLTNAIYAVAFVVSLVLIVWSERRR
jgi:hypothetical protein